MVCVQETLTNKSKGISGNSFTNTELTVRLEELLHELHIPTVALDCKSRFFSSCVQRSQKDFQRLTEHFITVHGLTDIACLTGTKGNLHAEQRLAGYREALKAHHIPCRKDRIFYGDFWVNSGKQLAEQIITGQISRPQAVVCANDYYGITALSDTDAERYFRSG